MIFLVFLSFYVITVTISTWNNMPYKNNGTTLSGGRQLGKSVQNLQWKLLSEGWIVVSWIPTDFFSSICSPASTTQYGNMVLYLIKLRWWRWHILGCQKSVDTATNYWVQVFQPHGSIKYRICAIKSPWTNILDGSERALWLQMWLCHRIATQIRLGNVYSATVNCKCSDTQRHKV